MMRIQEFEKALREAMRARPGQPVLAMVAGDASVAVPTEFGEAATTLASRLEKGTGGAPPPKHLGDDWA